MKVNSKSIAKTFLILVFLAILPVVGQRYVPQEFFTVFYTLGGFDLSDLLNRIALVGLVLSVLVLLRGHITKDSRSYLTVSSVWKIFWLIVVFFLLGIGHPETLGQATLTSKSEAAENSVMFNFRLFAVLATVVVALMIVRSVIIFRENESLSP